MCVNLGHKCPGSTISATSSSDPLEQLCNSRSQGVDRAYRQEMSVNGASKHTPDKGTQGVDRTKLKKPNGDQEVISAKPDNTIEHPA